MANPSERFTFEAHSDPKRFVAESTSENAARIALGVMAAVWAKFYARCLSYRALNTFRQYQTLWILTHPDPQVHTFRIRIGPVQSNPQGFAQAVTHAMGSRVRM